jgi:hypothetical protein
LRAHYVNKEEQQRAGADEQTPLRRLWSYVTPLRLEP